MHYSLCPVKKMVAFRTGYTIINTLYIDIIVECLHTGTHEGIGSSQSLKEKGRNETNESKKHTLEPASARTH